MLLPLLASSFVLGAWGFRVEDLVAQMDLSEKLVYMAGVPGTYTGNIPANERLGIPALKMQDGPQGFRTSSNTGGDGTSTTWPSALTIASSWDSDLVYRWATAMASEFMQKGANMALAPGLGIARVPTAGRNFEYLCGEDPTLGSALAKSSVRGFQDHGIIANAKHFVNNEIEEQRMTVSADVSERARFELYYPPFEAAAEVGVVSIMCAYNRINSVYACNNNDTLTHLRKDLGFDGWVVSDWEATKTSADSVHAGLDMEMPFGMFYNAQRLTNLLASGDISMEEVDRSVSRIISAMLQVGLFDNRPAGDPMANVTSEEHNALAREIAAKSSVLLQNTDAVLPLSAADLGECIAVFGDETTISGGGSGSVSPPYVITPQAGIRSALAGTQTQVLYSSGSDLAATTALAQKCRTAVVVVSTNSCEGSDRENLSLGEQQDTLVATVAAANPRTIVDIVTPGAVLMPWAAQVAAIVVSWMPGQEAGNALADVLFGTVNPSGRLPVTMPNKENEVGFTPEQYPGTGKPLPDAVYSEELLIGYRWYDANHVVPLFPFGHGLSYTTFQYSGLRVHPVGSAHEVAALRLQAVAAVTLRNTGDRDGDEVVQMYLQFPASAGEPPKQLRGFKKVHLKRGTNTVVEFPITTRHCSVWDSSLHSWQMTPGTFTVHVGTSSRDIRLTQELLISA